MADLNEIHGTVTSGHTGPNGGDPVDPQHVNDGDDATRTVRNSFVTGATCTSFWVSDLGAPFLVQSFVIRQPANGPDSYDPNMTCEGSADGTSWTNIPFTLTTGSYAANFSPFGTFDTSIYTFDAPATFRYWRLLYSIPNAPLHFEAAIAFGAWLIMEGVACEGLPAGTGSVVLDVYKINAPGDTIEYVATLNDASAKSLRPERNAIGSGQFSINRNSANATTDILGDGTEDIRLVKVRLPQVDPCPVFSYFLERGDFTLASPDQQGGEVFTFGGDGGLAYWDRAVWLADQFTVPWWTCAGTPAGTDKGQVNVQARAATYRVYTVAGGVITGFTDETVAVDACWFFRARRTYVWPGANPDGTDSKRFLVLLTSGPHSGKYFHPHQSGVTETLRSPGRINESIDLSTLGSSPGAVLYRMWQEATSVDRPSQPIPLMTIDFDATTDSDGNAWTTTDALAGVTASVGESFLTTLYNLVATGVIDVEMGPDLDFHAYNSRGRDLTGAAFGTDVVRFTRANIADAVKRELNDLPVATYTEVIGAENVVASAVLPDAATRVARETSSRSDSNDPDVLEAAGLADLADRLRRSDAVGLSMTIRTGPSGPLPLAILGGYLPGPRNTDEGNVWTHDLVRLHTGTDNQDFDETDLVMAALTISEDEAGGLLCQPELGSRLGANEGSFAGTAPRSIGGTSGPTTFPGETDDPITHGALSGLETDDHTAYETVIDGGGPTVQDHGSMGATETVNAANGNQHRGVLSADCTITVTPFADGAIVLRVDQDGTGGRAITWSGVTFAGDDQPAQAAGEVSWFVLVSDDGTVFGFRSGGGSAVAALDDLSDVTITAPAENDTLRYVSGEWVNDNRRWEPVTDNPGGGPELVFDGDDLVYDWTVY